METLNFFKYLLALHLDMDFIRSSAAHLFFILGSMDLSIPAAKRLRVLA